MAIGEYLGESEDVAVGFKFYASLDLASASVQDQLYLSVPVSDRRPHIRLVLPRHSCVCTTESQYQEPAKIVPSSLPSLPAMLHWWTNGHS